MIKNYDIKQFNKQQKLHKAYLIWQTSFTDTSIRIKEPESYLNLNYGITKKDFTDILINKDFQTITINSPLHAVTVDFEHGTIMYYWDKSVNSELNELITEILETTEVLDPLEMFEVTEKFMINETTETLEINKPKSTIKLIDRVILKEEIIYLTDKADYNYFSELLPELELEYDPEIYSITARFETWKDIRLIITIRKYS